MTAPSSTAAGSRDSTQAGVTFEFSYELSASDGLTLHLRLENGGGRDLFVLDRLWTLTRTGELLIDPEPLYRFVRGDSLRLLAGAAPLPRNKSAALRIIPWATRVAAGATWERTITLSVPVREHNVYYSAPGDHPTEPVEVSRIVCVVNTIADDPKLDVKPSPLDPTALVITAPIAAFERAKTLLSEAPASGLSALRRVDDFERLALPGEEPEPFVPLRLPDDGGGAQEAAEDDG